MRISAELLALAEQRTNPLAERELVLQGLGIPAIENMGAARDQFDTWDLSNNRISRLENLPRLSRLSSLLLAGNIIETIDASNLSKNVPNIKSVTLSYNHITSFVELANIGKSFPNIEFLSLVGNPVTRRQFYRLYVIQKMPQLKSLDYSKVKTSEREKATRLAQSTTGAALESDVEQERHTNGREKTFIPGEGLSFEDDVKPAAVNTFTLEQKQQIRELLISASSVKEIEEIESAVRRGVLPEKLKATTVPYEQPDPKRQKI